MQDRVPQARIYRVYHAPGWRDADAAAPRAASPSVLSGSRSARLDRRLVYEQELATGGQRRRVPDASSPSLLVVTATVKDGVDPARVEQRDRRRRRRAAAAGADRGGAAARAQPHPRRLRARHRAARRLRRPLRHPRREHDLRRPRRRLSRSARAHRARRPPPRCATPAARWLDAPHYTLVVTPFPPLAAGPDDARSHRPAAARRRRRT